MPIRKLGFVEALRDFPQDKVDKLLKYHEQNGGLSRYHKFEYFYKQILQQPFEPSDILQLADAFSKIMKARLTDPANLIQETLEFIKKNRERYRFFIASGSDEKELRYLCDELAISEFFESIHGSPTPKIKLVEDILRKFSLPSTETILIGDAHNDFEAASRNNIAFFGFNNIELKNLGTGYIYSFESINFF
ncbi:HAD family hydrolase [Flavihumibacter cheonanensis]|uniref:HAD family hydrolase n=1 Tax=Flavihumibacter cheonanensis TaxID=1442385 RepID=UPI001EF8FB0F|nr:HAD hydrolase-like protein [Flavihumibacter cheonanensis]MCG7753914.1 HAD hydrolase-like protein [Flavihumibacter cheonanensis]